MNNAGIDARVSLRVAMKIQRNLMLRNVSLVKIYVDLLDWFVLRLLTAKQLASSRPVLYLQLKPLTPDRRPNYRNRLIAIVILSIICSGRLSLLQNIDKLLLFHQECGLIATLILLLLLWSRTLNCTMLIDEVFDKVLHGH